VTPDTLRTRMGWLHGWVGFLAGLLLTAIFASGTLAVFDTEITRWMQPELDLPFGLNPTPEALDRAAQITHLERQSGLNTFLQFPSHRDPALRVLHFDGHEFLGPALDPRDGHQVAARPTIGGGFFYDLHFELRNGPTGERIVTTVGAAMLVAILSGIVIHIRALVPDLLVLRPKAARSRAWLDVHLVTGIAVLPFITMIAYTGTAIHARTILPPTPLFHTQPATDAPRGKPHANPIPPYPALPPLVADAEHRLAPDPIGFILFNNGQISISRADTSGPAMNRDHADYDIHDGHFLHFVQHPGAIARSQQIIRGLHYARWTHYGLRWLYFFSGLLGTAMMASGLVLFHVKRRKHSAHRLAFRISEGLTITLITGFPIATLALLWANRLIPDTLPNRQIWELDSFLTIWSLCATTALLSSTLHHARAAWRTQLATLATLGTALPLLDIATRSTPLAPVFLAIDLLALATGLAAFQARRTL